MTEDPDFAARLAAARLVAQALAERADDIRAGLPAALVDQLEAATRDANALVDDMVEAAGRLGQAVTRRDRAVGSAYDIEATARVWVAVEGHRPCPHIARSPEQPTIARLPLRRIDCGRCADTVINPPAGDADRCDWCAARGVTTFAPVTLQAGPALVLGDACPACASALVPGRHPSQGDQP